MFLCGDMKNMVFASTIVVAGHAEAIVTSTGMNTKVGKIAKLIASEDSPETPLQKKLRRDWKKTWAFCNRNMLFDIYNWINKENTSK